VSRGHDKIVTSVAFVRMSSARIVPQPARGDEVAEIIDRAAGDGSSGMSGAAFGLFPRPPRVRVKSGEDTGSSLQTAQSPNPSLDYKVDSHQVITCHELHVEVSMCPPSA
jgi:hypothetical protein